MQIGYENGAHLAEGTRNASRSGPFGILFSIVGAVVQALVLCIGTLFSVQDVKELQESPFPVATLFLRATNREMAIFFLVIVTVTQFGCLCNIMLAEAQLMWSMARDKCMPYHQFWYKLHSHRRIPLRIMILQAFICSVVILPVGNHTTTMKCILHFAQPYYIVLSKHGLLVSNHEHSHHLYQCILWTTLCLPLDLDSG